VEQRSIDIYIIIIYNKIMGNELVFVEKVNTDQIKFGEKLGLELSGLSIGVAKAIIDDFIDKYFYNKELVSLTLKQINYARDLGFDISEMTRRQGEAFLCDILYNKNYEIIQKEKLMSGVTVKNIYDKFNRIEIISSIAKDGTVYLKGGNGKRAWARNLKRIK
jgi:hypothetical protein